MGNGKGLAIIALILALGSILLAGFPYIQPYIFPAADPKIDNVWYSEARSNYTPITSYTAIPDLDIIINIETGQNVFVSFNSQAVLQADGNSQYIAIHVMNNDALIAASWTQIADRASVGSVIRHSLNLQYTIASLSTGSYNITIAVVTGTMIGNSIEDCSLLIMTYK
ncbi:MAG: hypothetical protein JXA99_08750 [Candidatus Lokiarchaeota archaeon]|nr:hypothetical protein [Candidatus Lokiarchaeota archaeon]